MPQKIKNLTMPLNVKNRLKAGSPEMYDLLGTNE